MVPTLLCDPRCIQKVLGSIPPAGSHFSLGILIFTLRKPYHLLKSLLQCAPHTIAVSVCRPIKAFLFQIAILANHQNGRDTHVRLVKVFEPV